MTRSPPPEEPNEEARRAAEARAGVDAAGWLLVQGLDGDVPLADAITGARELLAGALEAERARASAARSHALSRLEPERGDGDRQRPPLGFAARWARRR